VWRYIFLYLSEIEQDINRYQSSKKRINSSPEKEREKRSMDNPLLKI